MKSAYCVVLTIVCCVTLLGSGCTGTLYRENTVPTAVRALPDWGALKVYATDNVPFEYEEIGFISVNVISDVQVVEGKDVCSKFRDKAISMGADAILNLRCEDVTDRFWGVRVSGVAVKIKRP